MVGHARRKELASDLRAIFAALNRKQALTIAASVAEKWRKKGSEKVAEHLEDHIEECLSCLAFPEPHRRRIRTTNGLERFNQEIKRRSRVVRIFPNERSCLRLVSALAVEQSEEWITGWRYLDIEELRGHRRFEEREKNGVMLMES
jgi:putative transposase